MLTVQEVPPARVLGRVRQVFVEMWKSPALAPEILMPLTMMLPTPTFERVTVRTILLTLKGCVPNASGLGVTERIGTVAAWAVLDQVETSGGSVAVTIPPIVWFQ